MTEPEQATKAQEEGKTARLAMVLEFVSNLLECAGCLAFILIILCLTCAGPLTGAK